MRYQALATDYDGTLASHGIVAETTLTSVKRVLASGRKIVLVTGRHLPDLRQIFPRLDMFHRVVAENGALLYRPSTREEQLLCDAPPEPFLEALRQRKVPFSAGRGIVATTESYQAAVSRAIHELGLDMQLILNKGSLMVLPSGVNKATGLQAALVELGIGPQNAVGIGDAENDEALLAFCGFGVAVANALPDLKQKADFVTRERSGAGVVELCRQLLADDLASLDGRLSGAFGTSGFEARD